jgi:hypothetical protein
MPGEDHGWEEEAARVAHRRRALDIPEVAGTDGRNRALALSGAAFAAPRSAWA